MEGGGQFWGALLVAWLLGAPFIGGILTTNWGPTRGAVIRDRYRDEYHPRPGEPGPANPRPVA